MKMISVKRFGIFSVLFGCMLSVAFLARSQDPAPNGEDSKRLTELENKAKKLAKMTNEERTSLINEVKNYLQTRKDLQKKDAELAELVGKNMEQSARAQAGAVYSELGSVISKSSNADVGKIADRMMAIGRRLELPGRELVIKGKTLDGKDLDWKSYRGKVILVDFWATWCGPCLAEMPYLRKIHARYKDGGFDILGVSFDNTQIALEKYLEAKKLPWISIFDEKRDTAKYYNITGIPFTVLVGRDGKVLSVDPEHRDLERLLDKHCAMKEKN